MGGFIRVQNVISGLLDACTWLHPGLRCGPTPWGAPTVKETDSYLIITWIKDSDLMSRRLPEDEEERDEALGPKQWFPGEECQRRVQPPKSQGERGQAPERRSGWLTSHITSMGA